MQLHRYLRFSLPLLLFVIVTVLFNIFLSATEDTSKLIVVIVLSIVSIFFLLLTHIIFDRPLQAIQKALDSKDSSQLKKLYKNILRFRG